MRGLASTYAIFIAVAVAVTCPADELLDEAGRALAGGDPGRAVELYRQASAEHPTAEGANNLGVALERSGHFSAAVAAYEESLQLPDPTAATRSNLHRARLRACLQAGLPWTAGLFGCLLMCFAGNFAFKRLTSVWRSWRYRMRYRGVRVSSLTCRVQCRDGEYQPDGKAYPDSESLSVKAELLLPERGDIYPLELDLELVSPGGSTWRTLRESVANAETRRATVWYQVDSLVRMLAHSGSWSLRLILRNTDKTLATAICEIITHADLVADLQASEARLIAIQGERAEPETVIFPDVETLVPTVTIRPRRCHPSKYGDITVRLELANTDKPGDVEHHEMPLDLRGGTMEFCSLSRPVAGTDLARQVGRWEFRLSVDNHQLVCLPFVMTSIEQALASMRVERFDVAGVRHRGSPGSVESVAYVRDVRALCPVVTVTTGFPSSRISFPMTMGVCVNGEPVGGLEGMLSMHSASVELMPGEFAPPAIPDGRDSLDVTFVLLVQGRTLAIRDLTLRTAPPRCADAQGRIVAPPPSTAIDFEAEANRILAGARMGG